MLDARSGGGGTCREGKRSWYFAAGAGKKREEMVNFTPTSGI